jgi:hypothetical protein
VSAGWTAYTWLAMLLVALLILPVIAYMDHRSRR